PGAVEACDAQRAHPHRHRFSRSFHRRVLHRRAAHRNALLARWPGPAELRKRDPARLPRRHGHAVPGHPDRAGHQADLRPVLRVGRPAREVRLMAAAPSMSTSPGRRAWQRFKRNKLGYWSLLLFGVLVAASLFAEVLSNDRPLVVRYEGRTYFPVVQDHPETV